MGLEQKDVKYSTVNGQRVALGQHEKQDGSMAITGEKNPMPVVGSVQLSGSNMEYFGKSTDTKPVNANVPVGATFFAIDTATAYMNDGTNWVVI